MQLLEKPDRVSRVTSLQFLFNNKKKDEERRASLYHHRHNAVREATVVSQR